MRVVTTVSYTWGKTNFQVVDAVMMAKLPKKPAAKLVPIVTVKPKHGASKAK